MPNYYKIIQKYAENKLPKAVCVDFDGTITVANKYPAIGPPNHLFIKKLKDIKSRGYKIIISSCRWSLACQPKGKASSQKKEVEEWLKEHKVPYDELWAESKPYAIAYIDDRALNVKDMDSFDERFELLSKAVDPQHFDYSCIMANMPKDVARKTEEWGRKNIPNDWLSDDGDAESQRPDQIHVSVKYGIICEDLEQIKWFLEDQKEKGLIPVKCRLGKVSKFANEGKDVIKIEVISKDLARLHQATGDTFVNYEEFETFEPHVTIAYVKPGAADRLLGTKLFGDKEFTLNEFVFSIASTGEQIDFKV